MTREPIRILLVDDEAAHRKLARRALAGSSPELIIYEASSNDEALQLLGSVSFQAVILDLRLGQESGLVLLELIRKSYDRQTLPVLILSTSAMGQDIQASYQLGANCYIVKSSEPHEYQISLKKAVKFFLRQSWECCHDIPPRTG